jgi:hypothetical protein
MVGPPVYEDGLFELSIDPSYNSLDKTFNPTLPGVLCKQSCLDKNSILT